MQRSKLLPLIVACALFMENTDSTVIATSLPVIAQALGEDPIALKLALTSYFVSLAVFIPISGWMADRFGARTIFRAALGVFMLGSLACAVSNSLGAFVGARFLQGLGGAMMVPVGRLVILRSVNKSELVGALAYLTIPALVGPVIGPPLGGFITTYFDWRWIFLINIPIGIVGIVLSSIFFEDIREEDVAPLDIRGFLLSSLGFACLMLGLATGGRHLVPAAVSYACVAFGLAALVGYWFHARRVAHPVLDLSLLRIPTYSIAVLGGSLFRVATGAVPFLLPLMLQLGFGLSALQSGLITFVSAAGALLMKTAAKTILARFGFRRVLTVNAVLGAGFLALSGLFTPTTPHALMLTVLLIGGCFRSLQFTGINALSYSDVSNRAMSSATSLSSVIQQISLSLGVTVGAFALEATNALHGGGPIGAGDFPPAFLIVGLLGASSAVWMMRLAPDAGSEVSGHVPVSARKATAEAIADQKPLE
ncbi:DHA2 family efflux MFS transporter permease subunit [Bosea sp. BH3]|uniref:DHA2 family efflux MFS transporter permease subunit n=1 Tax=Bosea sp. BH3 TaxID=2871701 RepID=UPI0021CB5FFE|nr:DHA2 family efflux MFS transporter permease subunit [Bosea sp. BH3]MCU4179919.1 DHA2 family efflux MFS transporter permease subunit [Bosea sp. BH3]